MNYKGPAKVTWLSLLMSGEETELASLVTDIVWEQPSAEMYPGVGGSGGRLTRAAKVTVYDYPSGIGGATHFQVAVSEEIYQGETGVSMNGKNDEGVRCIQYTTLMKEIK